MSFAERWWRRPQTTWAYKAVFQVHLWAGILLGLYIAVVCATGSAIVFRNDLYDVFESWTNAGPTDTQRHLMAAGYKSMKWFGDLHGSLLLGASGLITNAIGGFLVSALCVTGLVVWWPGISTWRRGLTIRRHVGWKRLVFDLHKATGFWMFGILFMWGMTGGYFVFPEPFRAVINYFTPINPPRPPQRAVTSGPQAPRPRTGRQRRPLTTGGKILRGFSLAHYGNFWGWPVKALWFLLGLVPVVLVATSLLMWWNRVLNPALLRSRRELARTPRVGLEREQGL
jgi:uncharacterized iron-regulated membrane protein